MVLQERKNKMTSEQPLKKKLRRGDETEGADVTDFIHNVTEIDVHGTLQDLHLALPASVNEDEINNCVNKQLHSENIPFRTSNSATANNKENLVIKDDEKHSHVLIIEQTNSNVIENVSLTPAPNISNFQQFSNRIVNLNHENVNSDIAESSLVYSGDRATNHDRCSNENQPISSESIEESSLDSFQNHLIKQCLCGVSEETLRKPFEGQQISDHTGSRVAMLSEWPTKKVLQFLSNLQLLFDVYLKQNNKGYICSRIFTICDTIVCNENNVIEQIIALCETRNKYINYLAGKVLSSFLIIAKTNINNEWLETILNFLTIENLDYIKMKFSLEIVKRVVEWKDVEIPVLDDEEIQETASSSSQEHFNMNCTTVPLTDAESYDTSAIKVLIINSLESRWPELIHKIQGLIIHNPSVQSQACVLTFLSLWESTISVKANLSVVDTKPFYAHLEIFLAMLNSNLSPIIWKQLLSLFNEVLCYGSTLALQDRLPDDTCQLAHLIMRYVKDYRLLDCFPLRRNDGFTVNSFVGSVPSILPSQTNVDKTLLQKMVLLVLKSVAVTIKETRSDSSDSSVGSDDTDFYQDMQVIGRSIRDVLRKVDAFIKSSLDFHPETAFSRMIINLFVDQDDYMIESMVCTLDITVGISYRNAIFHDLINMLNPIHSFIEFLKIVNHDSDVLLDYLVSNETCFLLYLLRFLKYTKRNWSRFISSCGEGGASRGNELDDTMSVLIRLKMQITRLVDRGLFPYNITPILRLLEYCENVYEGNELS